MLTVNTHSNEDIIPQGLVLGQLLFFVVVVFINDLPLHITSNRVNCDMFIMKDCLCYIGRTEYSLQIDVRLSIAYRVTCD